MTIEELKQALDSITSNSAIAKARRRQIQKLIFELMQSGAQ